MNSFDVLPWMASSVTVLLLPSASHAVMSCLALGMSALGHTLGRHSGLSLVNGGHNRVLSVHAPLVITWSTTLGSKASAIAWRNRMSLPGFLEDCTATASPPVSMPPICLMSLLPLTAATEMPLPMMACTLL